MIELDKLKLVLFDFDDTLAIHNEHIIPCELDNYVNVFKYKENAYKHVNKNIHMQMFIDILKRKNIRLGLISSTISYVTMQAKQAWVLKEYNTDLENYCVGRAEDKIKVLNILARANNFKNDEIMLVDDLYMNLDSAAMQGFQACTPMEVVNYIERLGISQDNEIIYKGIKTGLRLSDIAIDKLNVMECSICNKSKRIKVYDMFMGDIHSWCHICNDIKLIGHCNIEKDIRNKERYTFDWYEKTSN